MHTDTLPGLAGFLRRGTADRSRGWLALSAPSHAVSLRGGDSVVPVKPHRFRFRAGGITIRGASFYALPVLLPLIAVSALAAGLAALILPLLIVAWDRVRWLDIHDDGRLVMFSPTKVVRFTASEVEAARWVRMRSIWEQKLLFEMKDGMSIPPLDGHLV